MSTWRRPTCRAATRERSADHMASRAAVGQNEPPTPEQLPDGGELIRAAADRAPTRPGRRSGSWSSATF